ncbi:MAG: hypothetical protein L6437_11480 [Kiritimatiellae bacterium]|nr:hypothetical protein [Verrucomicrobiota bacterium]MCG2660852.1 hypothetical protein [Kiritimatiellia bacterium]
MLLNHVGFHPSAGKYVVVEGVDDANCFYVHNMQPQGSNSSFTGKLVRGGDDFGRYLVGNFSSFIEPGEYRISVEASMKNYTNDIEKITETIGRKITLFGNIDPIGVLQNGSDEDLACEIIRQAEAGKKCRGFVTCTGSPITPSTPLSRVQRFLELGRGVTIE